jgi:hypothetical protein
MLATCPAFALTNDVEEFSFITPCSPVKPLLAACYMLLFLLSLLFDPEDGGDMFLRNVGLLSSDYSSSI